MEIRFGGSAADTGKDANTVIITVSVVVPAHEPPKKTNIRNSFSQKQVFLSPSYRT